LGLGTLLGRRRSENRIRRRMQRANLPRRDPEVELDAFVNKYTDRAYRVGVRVFNTSQARKAEGKVLLKTFLKRRVGETYRTVVGPKSSQTPTPKRRRKNA